MKTYSPALSEFAGQPVFIDQSKTLKVASTTFQPHPWHLNQIKGIAEKRPEQ